jgi:23S rRNA (cytosine1962-C5)-methyltransferase
MKLKVDVGAGQKTGFFVDQRESRAELANLSESKKVLNVFSYTGGFSVAALKAGAKKVDSVDLSKSAIKLCSENMALNAGKETIEHSEIVEDAFEFLSNKPLDYDIIVLDPPAFAKHLSAKKNALRAYQRLNQICFQKVKPGTLVFTFSCSQVVSKQDFHYAILNAGWNTNRGIKILKEFGQAKDHPVNLFHPETDYLKGLLLYIE